MAIYTAELNQVVQVTTNTEDNTVYAPNDPALEIGHWFAVKLMIPQSGVGVSKTTIDGNGKQIEDVDGRGLVSAAEMAFSYEYSHFMLIGPDLATAAWRRLHARPVPIPELFDKDAGSLLIDVNTPIPLVHDTTFGIAPAYFNVNGGNLECVQLFAGTIECRVYFEFVMSGNNQDASGLIELYTVSGTPTIVQGYGVAMSQGTSRAGTFYATAYNKAIVSASVGDIIGMRGSDDPGQSGVSYVLEGTGAIVTPI